LLQALYGIKKNYASKERNFIVSPFSTISSGYDSAAVSSMVRKIDVKECFTSRKCSSILPTWLSPRLANDDGLPIARQLGFKTQYLNTSSISESELNFLAASCAAPELVFHDMAKFIELKCQASVVFTGADGGRIWDVHVKAEDKDDEIKRRDVSNFNLSEIRLKAGFIQVGLPFMYARNLKDIVNISRSEEMKPWRLKNEYDKPIARRIVEEAGVGRKLFGARKKAVTKYYSYPKNITLRRKFFEFLKQEYNISPLVVYAHDVFIGLPAQFAMGVFYYAGLRSIIDRNYRPGLNYSRLMSAWATNLLADKTAAKLKWPLLNREFSDDIKEKFIS
ncbi:hypothetical protein ACFLRM_06925, partial [Acidobacteriota bacterium]